MRFQRRKTLSQQINSEYIPEKDEPLVGTVKLYHRHLFVCTGADHWAARLEDEGGFLQTLTEMIKARLPEMSHKVKMTACDAVSRGDGYDILLFPDNIRYIGVLAADLPALVEDHLIGNQLCPSLAHQPLTGHHIFVCTHGARDARCGQCGPALIQAFERALAERDLADQVTLLKTSHTGGHRFAGNVLIYPSGDWYGYVTPADVPDLVDRCLAQTDLVNDLWRGRMGLSPEKQVAVTSGQ